MNNTRVRSTNPLRSQKSTYNFIVALCIHSSASSDPINHVSCSTIVFTIGKKKSTYKWTQTVQFHVVQGSTVLLKCLYYPKQSTDSMKSLTKYRFHRTRTTNTKICTENQKTTNSQAILRKNNKTVRYHAPWCQTISKTRVIKRIW